MGRNASATKERLVRAARKMFSEQGFERTTVREIASEAGVNPALINRYFGGKEGLFATAVAVDLQLPDLSQTDPARIGPALARHFFERWEERPEDDLLKTLIRTAVTHDEAASRIREILSQQVTAVVEQVAGSPRAGERACLIATQILGLAYSRHVLGLSDREISQSTLVAMIGGTINRYLFEPLP